MKSGLKSLVGLKVKPISTDTRLYPSSRRILVGLKALSHAWLQPHTVVENACGIEGSHVRAFRARTAYTLEA